MTAPKQEVQQSARPQGPARSDLLGWRALRVPGRVLHLRCSPILPRTSWHHGLLAGGARLRQHFHEMGRFELNWPSQVQSLRSVHAGCCVGLHLNPACPSSTHPPRLPLAQWTKDATMPYPPPPFVCGEGCNQWKEGGCQNVPRALCAAHNMSEPIPRLTGGRRPVTHLYLTVCGLTRCSLRHVSRSSRQQATLPMS